MATVNPYGGLEPAALWRHFAALNAIPRPSGHEDAARRYVHSVAEAAGAEWHVDAYGNAIARVAARAAAEDAPVVAVQTHLDMVGESAPGVEHNWERDPIVPRRDGDRILATGTTLGADNGIGVAAALALLNDPMVVHGPLELVFTVEEETGLHGAAALDVAQMRAEALINLDSEDDGAVTVGCAGGADVTLMLALDRQPAPTGWRAVELRVDGLSGGHSGVQIQERHANAIRLAIEVLDRLWEAGVEYRLESFTGGSAHNAIPRSAAVGLAVTGDEANAAVEEMAAELAAEWRNVESDLTLELVDRPAASEVMPKLQAEALLGILRGLPHGVITMSSHFEDTVETSANLAIVRAEGPKAEILTSVRSLKESALDGVQKDIRELGERAGASSIYGSGYPGWEPQEGSPLVAATVDAYRKVRGHDPRIEVVHGGLECGVITAKKPGLEAVSFGPSIKGAHTPNERVYASTVLDTCRLLTALLAHLAIGR